MGITVRRDFRNCHRMVIFLHTADKMIILSFYFQSRFNLIDCSLKRQILEVLTRIALTGRMYISWRNPLLGRFSNRFRVLGAIAAAFSSMMESRSQECELLMVILQRSS